jgi:hypothetical protein
MLNVSRKTALFGFTAVAAVLLFASTAWACTAFKGQITLQGDAGGSSTVVANNTGGMSLCPTNTNYTHANSPGSVTVTVDRWGSSTCNGPHQLPNTSGGSAVAYAVSYVAYGFKDNALYRDCMWVGGHSDRKALYNNSGSAVINVNSNGYGTGTYNIPSGEPTQGGSPYEAGVCVSDYSHNSTWGIQGPLVIL